MMTPKERAAMQAAWVWMDWYSSNNGTLEPVDFNETITALREALAEQAVEPEQEPVHESLQIAAVALQDIACSSQTNNLLWWQIRAREAQKQIAERLTNSAPAEPVKQEPVAIVDEIGLCFDGRPIFNAVGKVKVGQKLYAAPVRTKDLTDDEIAQAVGSPLDEVYLADFRAVIAADREKNK